MYLLDTNIVSYLLSNRFSRVGERFHRLRVEEIAVSVITEGESWFGLEWKQVGFHRRLAVQAFYESVPVLPWTSDAARIYGDLRARLVRAGVDIGLNDTMIAAHAIALNATLVTNNTSHFIRVGSALKIENWLE